MANMTAKIQCARLCDSHYPSFSLSLLFSLFSPVFSPLSMFFFYPMPKNCGIFIVHIFLLVNTQTNAHNKHIYCGVYATRTYIASYLVSGFHYYWCWSQTTRYLRTLWAFATCKISSYFFFLPCNAGEKFFKNIPITYDSDSPPYICQQRDECNARYTLLTGCFSLSLSISLSLSAVFVIEMWNELEKCYYNTSIQWLWFQFFFSPHTECVRYGILTRVYHGTCTRMCWIDKHAIVLNTSTLDVLFNVKGFFFVVSVKDTTFCSGSDWVLIEIALFHPKRKQQYKSGHQLKWQKVCGKILSEKRCGRKVRKKEKKKLAGAQCLSNADNIGYYCGLIFH